MGHITHFQELEDRAISNFGIVTTNDVVELGLHTTEVVRFNKDGRLVRVGYGVYRLADYVPTRFTRYMEAVAMVGEGSYIYGNSSLVFFDLIPFNTHIVTVATPKRRRRRLADWVEVVLVPARKAGTCVEYRSIPSQAPVEALEQCWPRLTGEERGGVGEACRRSRFLSDGQREEVLEYLGFKLAKPAEDS